MHPALRQSARRLLGPRAFGHIQLRLAQWRARGSHEPSAAESEVVARTGGEVVAGPFAGLRFPADVQHEVHMLPAKLLGAYELELHDAVERVVARSPTRVVNVGAGDGYYAIGLARRLPGAHVVAVDIDARARRVVERVARENGVEDRVEIRRSCTPEELADLLDADALLVSDCESYEYELTDPGRVPSVLSSTVLVELHDHIDPRISPAIEERFRGTHSIEIVATQPRRAEDHASLQGIEPAVAARLLDEHRPGEMRWAIIVPAG